MRCNARKRSCDMCCHTRNQCTHPIPTAHLILLLTRHFFPSQQATRYVQPETGDGRTRKDAPSPAFVTPAAKRLKTPDAPTPPPSVLSSCSSSTSSASTTDPNHVVHTNANNPFYSRKTKSLGLLCSTFCQQDWSQTGICIDVAAKSLGVERRRIYDIINILESLGVVRRMCKNRYDWIGFEGLPLVLRALQEEGLREYPEEALRYGMLEPEVAQEYIELKKKKKPKHIPTVLPVTKLTTKTETTNKTRQSKPDNNNNNNASSSSSPPSPVVPMKRSLGKLSQQFLQLFLIGTPLVTLHEASDKILPDTSKGIKTKIRRLYDIANVLQSLHLIHKNLDARNPRPTFHWKYCRVSPRDLLKMNSKTGTSTCAGKDDAKDVEKETKQTTNDDDAGTKPENEPKESKQDGNASKANDAPTTNASSPPPPPPPSSGPICTTDRVTSPPTNAAASPAADDKDSNGSKFLSRIHECGAALGPNGSS